MATILFKEIIFGPIHSRRLGISLGVNLLPIDGKFCSFDCIYCECGYNKDNKTKSSLPSHTEVKEALIKKLEALKEQNIIPDVITFAGNGEPTIHPDFNLIIDDTIEIRNKYIPEAKISILSNAMHIAKEKVFEALKKVDNNILKLDSGILETAILMDQPISNNYSIDKQVELLKKFEGNFILQTMFLKGIHEGKSIDNTTEQEINSWLNIVKELKPKEVMIYTIDRETPEKNLEKISIETLKEIGKKVESLGIKINIAG